MQMRLTAANNDKHITQTKQLVCFHYQSINSEDKGVERSFVANNNKNADDYQYDLGSI